MHGDTRYRGYGMTFGGLQKLTLLDFPGMTACILFTKGCNFRCPFCHNASLVTHVADAEDISQDEIMRFLKKRVGLLDGVAITGGEPLMHQSIYSFIAEVRALGYKVKLDTNGSYPDRLKRLIDDGMLDYVAMDIKNSPQKYDVTAGAGGFYAEVKHSIDIIMHSGVRYEFRTTVVDELHDTSDFDAIGAITKGAANYYLQTYKDTGDIITSGLHAMSEDRMNECLTVLKKYVPQALLR